MEFNLNEICQLLDCSYMFRADIFIGNVKSELNINDYFDIEAPMKKLVFNEMEMKVIFTQFFNCLAPNGLLSFQKSRYVNDEIEYIVYIYDSEKDTSIRYKVINDKNLMSEKIYGKIERLETRDSSIYPEDFIAY